MCKMLGFDIWMAESDPSLNVFLKCLPSLEFISWSDPIPVEWLILVYDLFVLHQNWVQNGNLIWNFGLVPSSGFILLLILTFLVMLLVNVNLGLCFHSLAEVKQGWDSKLILLIDSSFCSHFDSGFESVLFLVLISPVLRVILFLILLQLCPRWV